MTLAEAWGGRNPTITLGELHGHGKKGAAGCVYGDRQVALSSSELYLANANITLASRAVGRRQE